VYVVPDASICTSRLVNDNISAAATYCDLEEESYLIPEYINGITFLLFIHKISARDLLIIYNDNF